MPERLLCSLLFGALIANFTAIDLLAQESNVSVRPPATSQTEGDGQSISVRRPSLSPTESFLDERSLSEKREDLYRELADEFNAFDRLGNLVRRVSQLVKPSVIHIEAHKSEEKGGQRETYDEAGSGILVNVESETWVLTNRHVVLGASPSQVMLRSNDGREFYPARIISDPNTDVAVMKLENTNLPTARMGDSAKTQIGDFVIAIGSPFGLSHSVTFGILSAKGRRDLSLGDQRIELQDFFQTDAAINPGNSGGPLLNLRGEVIGLNTAIASSSGGSEGIGFAIPINMAMKVAEQLIKHGELRRGYLGVTLDPEFHPAASTSTDLSSVRGALVKSVRTGSPAETAHLQRGDIVIEFNGYKIDNDDHLVAKVGLSEIGAKIPMIIHRQGKMYRTEVVLTDLD